MKLAKVSDSESQKEKAIMAELLTTDEGVLPEPTSIVRWSRNLLLFSKVAFPDIGNYLLGETEEYSAENLKSFQSLTRYRLFKDDDELKMHVFCCCVSHFLTYILHS